MGSTVNTYVYTESEPLDAILWIVRRAAAFVSGQSPSAVKLSGSPIDGMYQFSFDDNGDDRVLTLHTRCSSDLPSASMLEGVPPDARIAEDGNEGLVITIGAWGRGRQIAHEVGTALSFLGAVVSEDESNDEENYYLGRDVMSVEEVMKRYDLSAHQAAETLTSLRRGGASVPDGLEERVRAACANMTVSERTEAGGFAGVVADGDAPRP